MDEETQEDALLRAAELVGEALKETEARCGVIAQFINDCATRSPKTSPPSEMLRELSELHDHRARLLRRQGLIQEALDCAVGERPAPAPLPALPDRTATQTQRQVQVQRPRRRS